MGYRVMSYGAPMCPSKASTCCYMLIDLPCEKLDLGSLPRDDMITELDDNPLKMCKQRRDVTFPDGDKDSQFRFNMHLYGFCMSVQPPPLFLTLGSYVICNLCERHHIPASPRSSKTLHCRVSAFHWPGPTF